MVEDSAEFQSRFVEMLKKHEEVLNKSQLPESKKKKSAAVVGIREELEREFDVSMTENQLYKKIRNMKSRVKAKSDMKRTGNKPIVLKEWENKLLELMQGETNPSVATMPGGIEMGVVDPAASTSETVEFTPTSTFGIDCASTVTVGARSMLGVFLETPVGKRKLDEFETEDTRGMTYKELQRYVLLRQVAVLKVQERDCKVRQEVLLLEKGKLPWRKENSERFSENVEDELVIPRNNQQGRGVSNANPVGNSVETNQDALACESIKSVSVKEEFGEESSWIHAEDASESQLSFQSTHLQSGTSPSCAFMSLTPQNTHHNNKRMRQTPMDTVSFGGDKEEDSRPVIHSMKEDEFDLFGKFIASQLRNINLPRALRIQIMIQQLIAQERIKDLVGSNVSPNDSSFYTGSVSSSSY